MNEIEFRIECERSRIVIIVEFNETFKKLSKIIDSNNREHLIDVECINVKKKIIQSMFIFRESTLLNRYFVNFLHREILQKYNEFNYINDDLIIK